MRTATKTATKGSSMTMESATLTLSVDRDPTEVYEYISDPANMPKWASGLGDSFHEVDGVWTARTERGRANIVFTEKNDLGVLDHVVTINGEEDRVPFRVVPNGQGSELIFTVFRAHGMSDVEFERDKRLVHEDLMNLKRTLESR